MNNNRFLTPIMVMLALAALTVCFSRKQDGDNRFLTYYADTKKQDIRLYWKDDAGKPLKTLQRLADFVKGKNQRLLFAMNGGMYAAGNIPKGVYIEDAKLVTPLDTASGAGNFYIRPNGVFYITKDSIAGICTTESFAKQAKVRYATQSGPMLLVNRQMLPVFTKGSANVNIRNGVGILPDNRLVFVMSKEPVNFYDFAAFFQSLGCVHALYLDGYVSRTYLPAQNWIQTDGDFGVMIGVSL
ncbi:phosphodiester glycosidase family protein [Filimonas lacunae]|nr:phosphodiester glycosidase family protein [Filimonas lacunae]BAV06110.1 hypothetical protein FLA_2125 [Filimonas lacunae]